MSASKSTVDDDLTAEAKTGDRYEKAKQDSDMHIADLQRMTIKELQEVARDEKLTDYHGLKKQDLIIKIHK